jgi:magnesium transporter
VLRDLEQVKTRYLATNLDLDIYFDDIVDAHERIWDMLENYKEVIVALEETNESMLSHRVNDSLRVLTAISVIVLPLTLIASIFGMNIGLPGGGDPTDHSILTFAVVIGIMLAILVGMAAFFRKRRWL